MTTYEDVVTQCNLTSRYGLLFEEEPFHENKLRRVRGPTDSCDDALNQMFTEVGNYINQYDIYAPCVAGTGLDCMNYTSLLTYLNTRDVMKAIHAKLDLPWEWEVCTGNINYTESWDSVTELYPELINLYRVSVYSGKFYVVVCYIRLLDYINLANIVTC